MRPSEYSYSPRSFLPSAPGNSAFVSARQRPVATFAASSHRGRVQSMGDAASASRARSAAAARTHGFRLRRGFRVVAFSRPGRADARPSPRRRDDRPPRRRRDRASKKTPARGRLVVLVERSQQTLLGRSDGQRNEVVTFAAAPDERPVVGLRRVELLPPEAA